jgi:hypothetical protein
MSPLNINPTLRITTLPEVSVAVGAAMFVLRIVACHPDARVVIPTACLVIPTACLVIPSACLVVIPSAARDLGRPMYRRFFACGSE